ncbi:MAG: phosphatidylserine decarboxylase [Pseudomonadota bacterium]
MIDASTDLGRRRFPWALARIELWGMVGAVGAVLIGILLGMLWGPLFVIGLAGAILILFATRTAERAPPSDPNAIVAPVDGVLTSISTGLPPAELRLSGGDFTRLRVASSPTSTVSIHAPMSGEIISLIEEEGDTSVRLARNPDAIGLASAYATFGSGEDKLGLRIVTGGLGPRLDIVAEMGDAVRVGRDIGFRRLGGWCDIWLPSSMALAVWPGMTLKGAETRLVFTQAGTGFGEAAPQDVTSDTVPFEMPHLDTDAEADADLPIDAAEPTSGTVETDPEPEAPSAPVIEEDGVVKDASEQFARLRKKVESTKQDDPD